LNIPKDSLLSQIALPSQQLPKFEEEYEIARKWWLCRKCEDFQEADMKSGYIECAGKQF